MSDFKGSKFELAGFNIRQKGTLVDVFAIFCGLGAQVKADSHIHAIQEVELRQHHDAVLQAAAVVGERLPGVRIASDLAMALNETYPRSLGLEAWVSANDILEALVGKQDLAHSDDVLRLPVPGVEDVMADIGPEKMALLLAEMGKAKKAYLQGVNTFIPVVKLDLI